MNGLNVELYLPDKCLFRAISLQTIHHHNNRRCRKASVTETQIDKIQKNLHINWIGSKNTLTNMKNMI